MMQSPKNNAGQGILVFVLLSLCYSSGVSAEIFGNCGPSHGIVFALEIWRAFHGEIDFKLCEGQQRGQHFLLVTRDPDEHNRSGDQIKVPLEDATYQKLLTLYENAPFHNLKDEVEGLEGSAWCLETLRDSSPKACFWSPRYHSDERGLKGLEKLVRELWRIGATEPSDGPLY